MSEQPLSAVLLNQEREHAERRLAVVRLIAVSALAVVTAVTTQFASAGDVAVQRRAVVILLCASAWAALWTWFVRRRPYRPLFAYLSSTVDLLVVVCIILDWSLYPPSGRFEPTQARFATGYGSLYALIILTAVRLDWRTVLVTTLEAAAFYVVYLLVGASVSGAAFVTDALQSVREGALNPVDQVGRVLLLVFSGAVLAYVVHRADRLLRRSVRTAEEKGRLRQFISAQVVDEIESGRANLDLSGKKRRIAVLFCDIRGFTAMSETMQPVELLDLLNAYYEFTAEEIFKHHGTVDKYIGDGVMALFGAPVALANCSETAVRCAQAMLAKVAQFNQAYRRDIRIGIGVHTDEVAVGNLGTQSYKSYTAIGDVHQIGARIESATRSCDASLLFSENVKRDLGPGFPVRSVGEFSLKGVSRPMTLFTADAGAPKEATHDSQATA